MSPTLQPRLVLEIGTKNVRIDIGLLNEWNSQINPKKANEKVFPITFNIG